MLDITYLFFFTVDVFQVIRLLAQSNNRSNKAGYKEICHRLQWIYLCEQGPSFPYNKTKLNWSRETESPVVQSRSVLLKIFQLNQHFLNPSAECLLHQFYILHASRSVDIFKKHFFNLPLKDQLCLCFLLCCFYFS